jgi:hypothetical protein
MIMANEALEKLEAHMRQQQPSPVAAQMVAEGKTVVAMQPSPYVTAMMVQRPRDEQAVMRKLVQDIRADPEGLWYSWPVNNRDGTTGTVQGPTVKFSMQLAQALGNNATRARVIDETGTYWLFEGCYIDLETGFTCLREYRQAKRNFSGKGTMRDERAEDLVFEIGQSKAIRNAINNGVPRRVLMAAQRAVKEALADELSKGGMSAGIQRVGRAFKRWGILIHHLEAKVGKVAAEWTKEDFVFLRQLADALDEGQLPVDEAVDLNSQPGDVRPRNGKAEEKPEEKKPEEKKPRSKAKKAEEPPPPEPPPDLPNDPGEPPPEPEKTEPEKTADPKEDQKGLFD